MFLTKEEREEMGVLTPWDVQKGRVYPEAEKSEQERKQTASEGR